MFVGELVAFVGVSVPAVAAAVAALAASAAGLNVALAAGLSAVTAFAGELLCPGELLTGCCVSALLAFGLPVLLAAATAATGPVPGFSAPATGAAALAAVPALCPVSCLSSPAVGLVSPEATFVAAAAAGAGAVAAAAEPLADCAVSACRMLAGVTVLVLTRCASTDRRLAVSCTAREWLCCMWCVSRVPLCVL